MGAMFGYAAVLGLLALILYAVFAGHEQERRMREVRRPYLAPWPKRLRHFLVMMPGLLGVQLLVALTIVATQRKAADAAGFTWWPLPAVCLVALLAWAWLPPQPWPTRADPARDPRVEMASVNEPLWSASKRVIQKFWTPLIVGIGGLVAAGYVGEWLGLL